MSTTSIPQRSASGLWVRAILAIALIAVGTSLVCWAAFNVLRGPSSCGGDTGIACPEGFGPALLGGFSAIFVLLPVGIGVVATRIAGVPSAVVALLAGGLAATVYASRFVADPIVEGTVGSWIAIGILCAIAMFGLLTTVGAGRRAPTANPIVVPTTSRPARPGSRSRSSAGANATATERPSTADMDLLRRSLLQALAGGAGIDVSTQVSVDGKPVDADRAQRAQRLVAQHQSGEIDDATLRASLLALLRPQP